MHIGIMNKIKMLYCDRIDVFEETDANEIYESK